MRFTRFKELLIGRSLPTSAHTEERLTKAAALAILSSDALSSVAYATQETLLVLAVAGSSSAILGWSLPISIAIIALLAIVILSYRQTIRAYPRGGGSYLVARENLGIYPGLVAGGSLMIDYILTVAVSVSAGVDNIVSAVERLQPYSVDLCLGFVFLLMLANLRGVKESGTLFMIPTYAFVASIFLMMGVGFFNQLTGHVVPVVAPAEIAHRTAEPLGIFLILRAFAAGCTALTGVEAISDGVLVFKQPEWVNARKTLAALGVILGAMFLGISYLANLYQVYPSENPTVISMLAEQIFGHGWSYYFLVVFATPTILLLAANTSYADFPRLCYFLSRDGFLPRQLSLLGDRLVFSNGILLLSLCAALLVIIFQGKTTAIIPLYAVGVFTSFTLSQAGMVRHWFQSRERGWRSSAVMNGVGALATLLVLAIVVWTKFALGAWLVVVAIPLLVIGFLTIYRHYQYVASRLSIQDLRPLSAQTLPPKRDRLHPAIVVVGQINRGTLVALDYARTIADKVTAIHVDIAGSEQSYTKLLKQWNELQSEVPLIVLNSPYRSVVSPIVDFVKQYEAQYPDRLLTIIIPAFVTRHWWENILHNQTTLFLKAALRTRQNRVVTTVRYFL